MKDMDRQKEVKNFREECFKQASAQSQEGFASPIAYWAWTDEAVCESLEPGLLSRKFLTL